MAELIFENPQRLTRKDIFLQVFFALGMLFLLGLCAPLRNNGQHFSFTSTPFLVFVIFILAIFTFKASRETTLKKVEIIVEEEIVIFELKKQMGVDITYVFQLKELQLDIKVEPSRNLSPRKNLTIRDKQTTLKISSYQKGLSEKVLNDIVDKLNHYSESLN